MRSWRITVNGYAIPRASYHLGNCWGKARRGKVAHIIDELIPPYYTRCNSDRVFGWYMEMLEDRRGIKWCKKCVSIARRGLGEGK